MADSERRQVWPHGVAHSWSERGDESFRRNETDDRECAYTTLRKSFCSLEKDSDGKPVQKCEKIEQRLRKCAGRPQELVDSKVEVTEEDASTSLGVFSLDEEGDAGREYTFPHHWHHERSANGGASASGMQPFGGIFSRNGPASLEDLMQDVFRGTFDMSEDEETSRPITRLPRDGEHSFSLFFGAPFGGRGPKAPSPDQSARQRADDYYEALARGIQEV